MSITTGGAALRPAPSAWNSREFLLTLDDVRGYLDECFASCGDDLVFLEHACRIAAEALQAIAIRTSGDGG